MKTWLFVFMTAVCCAAAAQASDIQPYTPGIGPRPLVVLAGSGRLMSQAQRVEAYQAATMLGDPNRTVVRFSQRMLASRRVPLSSVAGGNGEAVGLWSVGTFAAQGSVTNMGVQPNYIVTNGDLFFHTHQFVNNQCFEYGINYSYVDPYLFGYNWCTGGNTPRGESTVEEGDRRS